MSHDQVEPNVGLSNDQVEPNVGLSHDQVKPNVGLSHDQVEPRWFEPRSGKTKDYETGICSFSTKNIALRSGSNGWLAQDNVSEWNDMSTRGLLFQRDRFIEI